MKSELAVFWDSLKRLLGIAADLMILNLAVILCCLLVFPAGAAWAACYAQLFRLAQGEETGFPLRPFFAELRKGFRKPTLAWLLLLLCFALLGGDYYYAVFVSDPVNRFFLVFSLAIGMVLMMGTVWLFPLMARYENTLRGHIRNSFLMAAAAFPRTLLMLLIQALFLAPLLFLPELFMYLGWLWVLFGFSLPMYLTVLILRKPLGCMPRKPEEQD